MKITHNERMSALERIYTRLLAVRGAEPGNPPGEPIEWCAIRKNRPEATGPVQARVRARTWFEARRLASLALGVEPEAIFLGPAK